MKKTLNFYVNKNDEGWIRELRKYAKSNHWSISLAIRELLSKYFEVNPVPIVPIKLTNNMKNQVTIIENKTDNKIDIAQLDVEMEQKVLGNTNIKQCQDSMRDKDGNVSCYFFDQGRSHYPFCVEFCWTNKNIWKERVRL